MNNEIANREPAGTVEQRKRLPVALDRPIVDLDEAWRLSVILAQTTMVPQALQNRPGNVLVLIMTGQELGLTWNQALREVYVANNGQPGLRGEFLLMRLRQAGHDYDHTDPIIDHCEFRLHRDHEAPITGFEPKVCGKGRDYFGRFSLADAEAAGLITIKDGKPHSRSSSGKALPWELYGGDMLFWRAVARAVRRGCPEVTMGFGIAGAPDDSGPDGPVVTGQVLPNPHEAREGTAAEAELREMDQSARTDFARGGIVSEPAAGNVVELVKPDPTYQDPDMLADLEAETAAPTADTPTEQTPAGSSTAQDAASPSSPDRAGSHLLGRVGRKFRDIGCDDSDQRIFTSSVVIRRWISQPKDMTSAEAEQVHAWLTAIVDQAKAGGTSEYSALHEQTERLRAAWEHDEPEQFEDDGPADGS